MQFCLVALARKSCGHFFGRRTPHWPRAVYWAEHLIKRPVYVRATPNLEPRVISHYTILMIDARESERTTAERLRWDR